MDETSQYQFAPIRRAIAPRSVIFVVQPDSWEPRSIRCFEDHELFADFLTTYYTDQEPESSFVLEVDGEIRGYFLGSRKPLRHQVYSFSHHVFVLLRAWRYRRYNERSRQFIRWVIGHGWREVPAAPRRTFRIFTSTCYRTREKSPPPER